MPIYEFLCKSCGHHFEELILSAEKKVSCPDCGSKNLAKEFSSFGVSVAGGASSPSSACDIPGPGAGGCCGGGCHGCEHLK
ncbi:MAG: zinc ribbon domain-containing protein [bacterium]|nr:zinc ribbon domain-containing protein [bacterium]